MGKSMSTSLRREIQKSLPRFLSIMIMVGLGCLFLVGLKSAAPDMRDTADKYYDIQGFMDLEVMSTLGLTQEDIDAFSQVEGVKKAEGNWSLDAMARLSERNVVAKVLSITDDGLNCPVVLEGTLPRTSQQCAVDRFFVDMFDLKLGDTLTLDMPESNADALKQTELTVTAIVESPLYLSVNRGSSTLGNGLVDAFVMLPRSNFRLDYYTQCDIAVEGAAEYDAYSQEYQDIVDTVKGRVEAAANERADLRYETLVGDAQKEIDDGQTELDDGCSEAEAEIAENRTALEKAQKKLADSRKTLDKGWEAYEEAEAEVEELEPLVDMGIVSEEELAYAQGELAAQKKTLDKGEKDYADGITACEDAEKAIADAETDLAEARTEGEEKLADARAELAEIEPAEVYMIDRKSNYGSATYDQNAERMDNLAKIFPVLFYLVAVLVVLTTMTRMVEDQRTEIGSIKAIGYSTFAITRKYLIYGGIAASVGGILGAAIGTVIVPTIIFSSYNIMYNLPKLEISVYWDTCLAAVLVGIACTVLAILWAMLSTARETPAALMRPKAPKAGKRILLERIGFLWRHLSFSTKVSFRNLFRYKKRLYMTVIGIAGCTALMISGLALRNSIYAVIEKQYSEVYFYQVQVDLKAEDGKVPQEVQDYLDESGNVELQTAVYKKSMDAVSLDGEASNEGYLMVALEPDSLKQLIALNSYASGEALELPDGDAVLMDEKAAELLGATAGDEITLDFDSPKQVRIADTLAFYVRHFYFMGEDTYTGLTGETPEVNELLIRLKDPTDEKIEAMNESLLSMESVLSASDVKTMAKTMQENLSAINAAVMVIILSAAALALVVLYNLTNINITERERELATIKVLGFHNPEVAMYIYRENIMLTLAGIAIGQLLGKYLSRFLIRTVEVDLVMFGREAVPENYLMSIALSLIFALLVNLVMYFRMKHIDMISSLKSVE